MFYKKIIKFLAILALFTPLIVSKGTLFPFIFGKAIAFQVLVELMLIVYLYALFVAARKNSSVIARSPSSSSVIAKSPSATEAISQWLPRFSLLHWALLAFFIVLVLSTVFGADPYMSFWSKHERMEGLFTLLHYFVFFFILTAVFRKREDWLGFLRWSVIAAFLVSLHALAQLAGLPGFIKGIGVSGTLGNSSFLATYLIFNSFFALFLFLEKISTWNAKIFSWDIVKGFYFFCFIFFNLILILTGTRAALYGQFLGLFVFFGLYGFFLASPRLKKTIVVSLVLAVIFVSLIFVFRNSGFVRGNRILARVTDVSFKSATLQQRFGGWRSGLEGFKARPLLGWGQENYYIVFYKFLDPYFYGPTETFDRPHNKYIDILVSNGALGLLAYLGIFAVLFFWIWQSRLVFTSGRNKSQFSQVSSFVKYPGAKNFPEGESPDRRKFVSLWFLGWICAYLIQNALLFDMPTSYPFFFLTLGFANFFYGSFKFQNPEISKSSNHLSSRESGATEAILTKQFFLPKIIPVLTFILIPAVVFVLWWGNLKPYADSRLLIQALTGIPNNLSDSFAKSRQLFKSPSFVKIEGRNVLTNALIDKGEAAKPPLAENKILRDYVLFMAEELEKGIKESPLNYRYYSSLANLYHFLGSIDVSYKTRSEEVSRQAAEIFPRDIGFLLKIFVLRFQADDLEGSEAIIREVLAKAPNSHLAHWDMAMIYYKRGKYDLAKKEAEIAVSLGYPYTNSLNSMNFLAAVNFNLGYFEEALKYFLEAYKSFSKNPQLIADIATTYYRLGKKDKAKEWILKVKEISPGSVDEVNKFLQLVGD